MSMQNNLIEGFSKLTREEKIAALGIRGDATQNGTLDQSRHCNIEGRRIIEDLTENVLSSFHLPFSVAPNFLINNRIYHVPMVIEESSVVAAASSAAKYWALRDGFQCHVVSMVKKGQVHFLWDGPLNYLAQNWNGIEKMLMETVAPVIKNMVARGGGIMGVKLLDMGHQLKGYHQLDVSFDTADSMGANFINTCLEKMSVALVHYLEEKTGHAADPIMSILSNFTPECLVECRISCRHQDLDKMDGEMPYARFVSRFEKAVQIAQVDISRAVTHNKGIFNGIDAVLLATGNDFRATAANAHAFASRDGQYRSLTSLDTSNGIFQYTLLLPLAIGTVGGATSLHPLAQWSLNLLGGPNAKELMQIVASAGMANNFAAIRSLVTKGIQKGHMKMHLRNILNQINVSDDEREGVLKHFENRVVGYSEVIEFLKKGL
jgi:hydroxymethylglutaryl-CoA reductase